MDDRDFLSGESGALGRRTSLQAELRDAALGARAALRLEPLRLARAARTAPPRRRVLVAGVDRPGGGSLMRAARAELARSRHAVELAIAPEPGGRGKFENLNALLADRDLGGVDWLLVLDDDVALPRGFLDRFLFLAERFGLDLAQPAHRRRSQTGWAVARRHAGTVARETAFVEIGPVTAFAARTFPVLLPFPGLRMGWGLDVHWAALAREHGWRLGVVDATPVRHATRPVASAYAAEDAVAEARAFLAERPYVPAAEAARTLVAHSSW